MQLSSSAFSNGSAIPRRFTCDGENLSPPLDWEAAPSTTRSFVLLCDDPDAPAGKWHHWAVYDIDADLTRLAEGASRDGGAARFKQATNDFHPMGYGGPCPPGHGRHRYHFRLLALSVDHLPLGAEPSCREVEREARRHVIAEATWSGSISDWFLAPLQGSYWTEPLTVGRKSHATHHGGDRRLQRG